MTTRTKLTSSILLLASIPSLLAIEDPNLRHLTPGAMGIGVSEAMRLNAICASRSTTYCTVSFSFMDQSGRTLKRITKTIAPGQADYVELSYTDLLPAVRDARRVLIIPCIDVERKIDALTSVEIFDTLTGRIDAFSNVLIDDPNL